MRLLRHAFLGATAVLAAAPTARAEFNFEVGLRVEERLTEFMSTPANILDFVSNYQTNGALGTSDRDEFLLLGDALMKSYPHWMIYYGLESGELSGNFHTPRDGNYREPGLQIIHPIKGNGGYEVNNSVESDLHYMTCVAANGTTVPCLMNPGDQYISCIDDCALEKCADEASQRDCSALEGKDRSECEGAVAWCQKYEIKSITEEDGPRGFIPLNELCLDKRGLPSQEVGGIYKSHAALLTGEGGSCYYDDGVTLVNRSVSGNFRYCETLSDKGQSPGELFSQGCDSTFDGAFRIWNYDPRYRPWYIDAKAKQRPYWTAPFIFWDPPDMGMTYVKPIYKTDDQERQVFDGVLALDYKFLDIADFLSTSYSESATVIVAILEETSPHYVIATSRGGIGSKKVLASDESQPCPQDDAAACKTVRMQVDELDNVVSEAFATQIKAGFPETELLPIETSDGVYASQTKRFTLPGQESINWRILILSPIEAHEDDTIQANGSLAAAIIVPSIFGFLVCSALLFLYMKKRHRREIIYSDWRFTGLFIFNASLLNLACLSLLGENTDGLCLLRMWMLHFFFVVVFAPLFVKTYRMYLLVGRSGVSRQSISHTKTALMMAPFVAVEVLILLIFTFVDPSKETSLIEQDGSVVTYRVVCSHDTAAFFAVQLIYEGGLILVGCFLSYKTRNMDDEFGEAKQLLVAMYNIALVATLVLIVANAAEVYDGTLRIFVAVGVAWTTVFSSGVFVIPRLLRVRSSLPGGRSRISGLSANAQAQSSRYSGIGHSSRLSGMSVQSNGLVRRSGIGQDGPRHGSGVSQNPGAEASTRSQSRVSFHDTVGEEKKVAVTIPAWAAEANRAVAESPEKEHLEKENGAATENESTTTPEQSPSAEEESSTAPEHHVEAPSEVDVDSPAAREESGAEAAEVAPADSSPSYDEFLAVLSQPNAEEAKVDGGSPATEGKGATDSE